MRHKIFCKLRHFWREQFFARGGNVLDPARTSRILVLGDEGDTMAPAQFPRKISRPGRAVPRRAWTAKPGLG